MDGLEILTNVLVAGAVGALAQVVTRAVSSLKHDLREKRALRSVTEAHAENQVKTMRVLLRDEGTQREINIRIPADELTPDHLRAAAKVFDNSRAEIATAAKGKSE